MWFALPGEETIPELIANDRKPYYEALVRCDEKLRAGGRSIGTSGGRWSDGNTAPGAIDEAAKDFWRCSLRMSIA